MDIDGMRKFYGRRIDGLFGAAGRPVVVAFREKHGDGRYACLDRGELEAVCLEKLWERYHMGYYGNADDEGDPPAPPPIPKADIPAMPEGLTRSAAAQEWRQHEASLSRRRAEAEELEAVTAALRGRDGTLAFAVLQSRGDAEYEGFDVEPGAEIGGPPAGDLLSTKDWA